jgi:hypothetical protein
MAPLDLTRLVPSDGAAALRSYLRRYREALAPADDDEDIDELAKRVGPGGRSALELVSDVTRTWVVLHEGLRQITMSDTPILHPAVQDRTARQWEMPPPDSLDEALALHSDEAASFAEAIDHVNPSGWSRSGAVSGGGSLTALDIVKEAVQVGHHGLTEVEEVMRAARA